MNEYQDQAVWFELYEFDGFKWIFVADFDTRDDAKAYAEGFMEDGEEYKIKRVYGLS